MIEARTAAAASTGRAARGEDALLVQFLDWCARIELRRLQLREHERDEGLRPGLTPGLTPRGDQGEQHATPAR